MKRKRHKCVLVYKCLNMLVSQYLCNYFIRNYNVHSSSNSQKNRFAPAQTEVKPWEMKFYIFGHGPF